jgi:hypothetical protein
MFNILVYGTIVLIILAVYFTEAIGNDCQKRKAKEDERNKKEIRKNFNIDID